MDDPYGVFINPRPSLLSLHRYDVRKRGRHQAKISHGGGGGGGCGSGSGEILMNLSSDSDDEFDYNKDIEMMASVSDLTSDSDFCQPIPIARGPNRNWITKPTMRRVRKSQVPCGIGARARTRRHGSLPMMTPIDHSSSYETETTNDDDDDDDNSEYRNRKHRSPPPSLLRGLSMIEELSPIGDSSSVDDIPKVPSLQLSRNWHPLATSTTTSVHQIGLPKTNPHHLKAISTSTPTASSSISSGGVRYRGPVLSSYSNIVYDTLERPASFFEEQTPRKDRGRPQSEILSSGYYSSINWKPDHFGLPAPFARRIGCKGKLQLTMSISGSFLTVSVAQAVFFLDPAITQTSSYVRVELKRNPLYNRRLRSSSEDRCGCTEKEQSFRTRLIPLNNRPQFYENFTFELTRNNYRHHDLLAVSVWITNADNSARKRMLGCMAFPIRRLIRKANLMTEHGFDENLRTFERTVINDGDFFLLRPELGERQNFPENKINVKKYYDDIGLSSSSSVASTHSPPKIMRSSDWNAHHQQQQQHHYLDRHHHHNHNQTLSLSPSSSSNTAASILPAAAAAAAAAAPGTHSGYTKSGWTYGLQPCGAECSSSSAGTTGSNRNPLRYGTNESVAAPFKVPISIRHNDLDYTTGSSSIASTTTFSDKLHRKLIGLPSITTTSDLTSDGSSAADANPIAAVGPTNAQFLCPSQGRKNSENTVRRTASFTFSPKASVDKVNRRPVAVHDNIEPKRRLGRFAKKLGFIRSKMDTASTSTLYPSKEEIRQWQESFESLLNHKYGFLLFRTFLKGEFSDENVDFWIECEEFRKMKEGKKATIQKAHSIYNQYIAEQSPKEVNLDSDTRAATKAALENGAKPNMFSLAQTRIEQLMAKDSYRRFLKSRLFLDLLNDGTSATSTGSSSDRTLQEESERDRQSS